MAEASYPEDLKYHAEHDWARIEGETATFGITWYAQDALGEVVFFDPPKVGATIAAGEAYAEVESVKAVSDVVAPLSGEVLAAFEIEGQGIPRQGNPVLHGGEQVGSVTSGTFSPSLELGAGIAYLPVQRAAPGTSFEIDVRGKLRAAIVATKPLYDRDSKDGDG